MNNSIQSQYDLNTEKGQLAFLQHIVRMVEKVDEAIPEYSSDTRHRDKALLNFVRSESLLGGVVSSVVSQDKSRPWKLVGPARQVSTYSNKLHNVNMGQGWRSFISKMAQSWYATNLGFAAEIGFRSKNGPAETLYSFDPTKLRLTGNAEYPLVYYKRSNTPLGPSALSGDGIYLRNSEFLHGNSLPALEEELNGAGYCAVERALNFTRILIGLSSHLLEKLGIAPPKGILHGKGITRKEWESGIEQSQEAMDNANISVYRDVITLLTSNEDAALELIGLSELPDNFDLANYVEVFMNAYALAFNVSLYSIWMPASNNLGRGSEAKSSLENAKIRGELDFSLSFQEDIQTKFMPETVNFTFDNRTDAHEAERIERDHKYTTMVKEMMEIQTEEGGLISKEQGLQLLAQQGIIPNSWADNVSEELETTDLQESRKRALHTPSVQRAAYYNPDEPIVEYIYNDNTERRFSPSISNLGQYYYPEGKVRVLFERGSSITKRVF